MACDARGHLNVLSAMLIILLSCGFASAHEPAPAVSMYMSAKTGVLDLRWDQGPQHLATELIELGLRVDIATEGQPDLAVLKPGAAYIIPTQNGPVFYSSAEDMISIAHFINSGGLVVLLDANRHGCDAHKQFVAEALSYKGNWASCKSYGVGEQDLKGKPSINERATSFLPSASWPAQLEEVQDITLHSWCHHTDPTAVSWPLYSIEGDSSKLAAQAYGKIGSPGAVVWLGYNWKAGPQPGWGSLLEALVEGFRTGGYRKPLEGGDSAPELDSGSLEGVLKEVTNVAEDVDDIVRRFLATGTGTYPPPPPSPQPTPAPPTPPPVSPVTVVKFKQMLGMGVYLGGNKSVLWYDDPAFRDLRRPRAHPNLIFWNATNECSSTCQQCPRAWQADATQNVTILFREPWQLDSIIITQIQNPGVLSVELLPWPAVPIPGLDGVAPKQGLLGPPIWNVSVDTTRCGGKLRIPLGERSGTNLAVSKRGSQSRIPPALRQTVVGGVNIIVKAQPLKGAAPGYTYIQSVRFDGRALYPKDPSVYGPGHP